ncbi:MAG: DUF2236 domain-containing protein [Anaerolineales bacterium]|nr:DUF2236 domain-containing protein [Anaerolineales bacterium]
MKQSEVVKEYEAFLRTLAKKVKDPACGFFGPGSMAWQVNGELTLGFGVLRALFMQVAHPKVAQGVGEHSDFRRKPFTRAYNTLTAQQVIVFGTCDEAIEALKRIYARHLAVRGKLPEPLAGEDAAYRAIDQDLLMWVFATLIDSVVKTYQEFVRPFSAKELQVFYEESKFFAKLMGIEVEYVPLNWSDFEVWMAQKLQTEAIRVTPLAKEIGDSLLRLPVPIFKPFNSLLAGAALPPKLRAEFGFAHSHLSERLYRTLSMLSRFAVRFLPRRLRTSPTYWQALRRVKDTN